MEYTGNPLIKKIIIILVFYLIIVSIMINGLGLPNDIRYISDVICFFLLLYIIKHFRIIYKRMKLVFIVVTVFLLYTLIGFFINQYSIFEYMWGLRNIGRAFIIFFSSYIAFEKDDVDKTIKCFEYIFYLNIIACAIEVFVFSLKQDDLGGTFFCSGGNGFLLMLINIMIVFAVNEYMNKKMPMNRFIIIIVSSILISAIGEIKAFFIFFAIILIMSIILNKKSLKYVFIIIFSIIMIRTGANLMYQFFPEASLTFQNMLQYIGGEDHGYSSDDDISRIRAFKQIDNNFFRNSWKYKLIGYGLGSCDASTIPLFNTAFYNAYYKLHYVWFSHAMLYLETGYIGYILYIMFYIGIIIECLKLRRKHSKYNTAINSAIIISVICIVTTWYNSILRIDLSFFVFEVLALPFVYEKKDIETKELKVVKESNKLY